MVSDTGSPNSMLRSERRDYQGVISGFSEHTQL